jgi:hypothetical protein
MNLSHKGFEARDSYHSWTAKHKLNDEEPQPMLGARIVALAAVAFVGNPESCPSVLWASRKVVYQAWQIHSGHF